MTGIDAVLSGQKPWAVVQADALSFLAALPAASVDLVFFSPPYEQARLYLEDGKDMGIARNTEAWVKWMVEIFQACLRVSKGLVACVCEGQTRKYKYTASPFLLMADLHRAGITLRKPPIYHRVGIPGSGGPDWLRNDWEPIICATNGGKLPWSDNTALGHPPRWAPGGEMSNRLANGARVNQWGHSTGSAACVSRKANGERDKKERPSHYEMVNGEALGEQLFDGQEIPKPERNEWGGTGHATGAEGRKPNGEFKTRLRIKGGSPKDGIKGRRITSGHKDGDTPNADGYDPPARANPGNVLSLKVGGGLMGNKLCHDNEAPFPEKLAEWFVRSFCPPGGICVDPFSGSGTTVAVAYRWGRRGLGCDLRASQVELSRKRIGQETPMALLADAEPPQGDSRRAW